MSTTALFCYGKDLFYLKRDGVTVDYERMLDALQGKYDLDTSNYYAVMPSTNPESLHQLLTWLRHHGYQTHVAKARSQRDTVDVATKLVADMVAAAATHDTIILAATGVQFTPAVKKAQELGSKVIVAATQEKADPRLLGTCDEFIDIEEFSMDEIVTN